jgi:hypothetical protein
MDCDTVRKPFSPLFGRGGCTRGDGTCTRFVDVFTGKCESAEVGIRRVIPGWFWRVSGRVSHIPISGNVGNTAFIFSRAAKNAFLNGARRGHTSSAREETGVGWLWPPERASGRDYGGCRSSGSTPIMTRMLAPKAVQAWHPRIRWLDRTVLKTTHKHSAMPPCRPRKRMHRLCRL